MTGLPGIKTTETPIMLRMSTSCLWITLATIAVSPAGEIQPSDIAREIDARLGIDSSEKAPLASDAEFLRRVTLDLAGRIPTIAEVHEYLADERESRQMEAIRRLMQSGVHDRTMATFWRRSWVPQADTPEFAGVTENFELWVGQRLQAGTPYDQLVQEIVTFDRLPAQGSATSPVGFYDANQNRPENLAASTTRAFLGINLDCAQCHDHPFARWTRGQFWETAAFFALPEVQANGLTMPPKVRVPDTDLEFAPALLTRNEIEWPEPLNSVGLREILVDWMQHDDQQLLARNAVNRLWSHFFGEAIIEPMDDLSRDEFQTGDRAALLDALARQFIASGYNLDVLVEGMVRSQAYRLASAVVEPTETKPTETSIGSIEVDPMTDSETENSAPLRWNHAAVRGLSGEQLYDSLQTAAGLPPERSDLGRDAGRSPRREFAAQFYVERTHNAERSISQALTLMNGSLINELTTMSGNRMLGSVLSSPFMSEEEQIDTVFIAVLGRHARDAELQVVQQGFAAHPQATREQHLGNLFWVLVNTSEFNTNH
ncbi:DUF1549 domain-containing protein [bacterium]|nr:DUF1549 domain-containing protein [bacterium]